MNLRVLGIELRRSVAPWAGGIVLASALAFLYLLNGEWWQGTTAWTAQWTTLALWTRGLLFYLWPVAVGLGALQGLRDHRSTMSELLASTPRPPRHRAAASAGATTAALVSAFALVLLVGAVQVFGNTEYAHLGWLPIALVGALSLVAGAVLGMGAGRALPSPLTPPVLAMTAFVFTALLHSTLGRTDTTAQTGMPSSEPNRLSLLSPAVQEVRHALLTFPAPVNAGQAIWLLGMAVTGFALLVAATRRGRLLALAPMAAAAALALLVLPSDPRRILVVDEDAAAPVCDGRVCVAEAHRDRLAGLAGPGRDALSRLHDALGEDAPDSVGENTTVVPDGVVPRWSRERVLFTFDDETVADARGEGLTAALIGRAMVPGCVPAGWSTLGTDEYARAVAVAWVVGDLTPLPGTSKTLSAEIDAQARPVWNELKALPRSEQLARINTMRRVALSCDGDSLDALKGGTGR
ncbi:hypothetical protein [Streptomyces olivaceus]|uniref:hypothetical protein n=1 Tax=Streptomyces olivaceus TaxID=47716 RepID=UPI001CCDFF4A|nr:hypothetical protein [Streptomyces olivaceus]MBZ6285124.1 hypothetical protein [Streptomyces olivaceus]